MKTICLPDLAAKVAALSRPSAYAEPTDTVERLETHRAFVFLTARHAYKLKKPVRQGTLDLTSLAARRRLCAEELRLNRRLAGHTYLGVVPLTLEADGRFAVNGRGEVVDWLVRMRRLPRERMLDAVIAHGGPSAGELAALAERLADFHATAPVVHLPPGEYRRRLRRELLDSRAALAGSVADGLAIELTAGLLHVLESHPLMFESRELAGRLVEGHGDLRAEHVCLLPGGPVVIDCLEFDPDLRVIDPVDELAFLGLDCERLGARQVGPALLAAWTARSGDDPPPELAGFYAGLRGLVRARLAILHLLDADVADRARWPATALLLLKLAHRHVPG